MLISTGKQRSKANAVPRFYRIYFLVREPNVEQLITSVTCVIKTRAKGTLEANGKREFQLRFFSIKHRNNF